MSDLEKIHHQKYRRELRPFMEMLKHKQSKLEHAEWMILVSRFKNSMLKSPDQYLTNTPGEEILHSLLNSLFKEFIEQTK